MPFTQGLPPCLTGVDSSGRKRRTSRLEKNWDRPLSDEVERLQDALKRLESTHAGDIRRLRGAESEWWRLLRIAFVVCLGLVALLLWYIDRYSETKSTLASADAEHVRFRGQSAHR